MKAVALAVAVAFVVLFLFPRNAYAYVDPGTGSYLLQITLGVVFASAYAIKLGWHRIMQFFRNLSGKKNSETEIR